jgi:ketosteroid isomerase-like protein
MPDRRQAVREGSADFMSPIRMSKIESGVRTVLEFNEAFNRHDVMGMMKHMSDDCVFEDTNPAPDGTVYKGKEAVTQYWQAFFRESPQAHIEIEEISGMGLRCVMRWKYDWTDSEGKKGYVRGVDIFKLKDGLISEKLSYVKG